MYKNAIIILLAIFIIACKNDSTTKFDIETTSLTDPKYSKITNPDSLPLPSACEILSPQSLQTALGMSYTVTLKDSPDPTSDKVKSCFFKWDDPNASNAAILIQVLTNPVYEEFPGYITSAIDSKINSGENMVDDNNPIKYKRFFVGDLKGAYSFEQARFFWSDGYNYQFMLAFNVHYLKEKEMLAAAEKITKEVMAKFYEKLATM